MKVTEEVKTRVHAVLREKMEVAERHFGRKFIMPTVRFTRRGTVAGVFMPGEYAINFNPVLLMENVEAFLHRTVPHELAHAIDGAVNPDLKSGVKMDDFGRFVRTKRSVHGPTWKAIMRLFDAPVTRCHSYDVTSVKSNRKKFEWMCTVCGQKIELGAKRHTKMQRSGGRAYFARSCKKKHGPAPYSFASNLPLPAAAPKPTFVAPPANTAIMPLEELKKTIIDVDALDNKTKKKLVLGAIRIFKHYGVDDNEIVKQLGLMYSMGYHNARYYVKKVYKA